MASDSERNEQLREQWLQTKPDGWAEGKHSNEREVLFEVLMADEELVAVVSGSYRSGGHTLDMKNGLMVATDQRILFLRNGLVDVWGIAEVVLNAVESTTFKAGMMGGEVRFSVREPHNDFRVSHTDSNSSAEHFAIAVEKLLAEHQPQDGQTGAEPVSVGGNTALEQWLRAKPNPWGEGKHKREREFLFEMLGPDEVIVALASGDFGSDGHRLNMKGGLLVATTQRILFLRNGLSDSAGVSILEFDAVESVDHKIGVIRGEVSITARRPDNSYRVLNVDPKDSAKYFAVLLENLLGEQEPLKEDAPELSGRISPEFSERDKLLRQWFESTPKAWRENEHRKEREVLFGILQPDENIVATIVGIFDSYGHHLSPNICLMAATTERVLLLRRGRSDARDSAEFSFDTFESVTGKAGMIEGEIKLIARQPHNDVRMLSIRPKDSATYFAVSLEKLLGEHLRSQGIVPTPNRRDRILKQWLEVMPKGWGTFGDDGMHKGERGMLIDIVDDDEDVLALVGGTFRADTNRIHKHNGIAVATTKRILLLDKGVLGSKEVMEIGYRNIEAITYSTGMLMGGIQITGLGTVGFRIEDIKPKESNKPFADCVRQLIDQAREQDLSPRQAETLGQLSSADELQKLVSLLQDGHITPEEFATMKFRIIQGK